MTDENAPAERVRALCPDTTVLFDQLLTENEAIVTRFLDGRSDRAAVGRACVRMQGLREQIERKQKLIRELAPPSE